MASPTPYNSNPPRLTSMKRISLWGNNSKKDAVEEDVSTTEDGNFVTPRSSTPVDDDNVPPQEATLSVEAIPDKDAIMVQVRPPIQPRNNNSRRPHVPCDIVLVVDVSGSMSASAPVPGDSSGENTGLSVLDLTKHAARTIIETMDADDRLGVVTFSSKVKVLQPLTAMTDANKEAARTKVNDMHPQDATNLWHGILEGLKLFKGSSSSSSASTRVPAILILTDGMPNHMCPPAGYVPKLKAMSPLPATLHTFGFGYSLRSGLLKSIAEVGGGNYGFIPDAGMIGTVFVHAVAHLQSTYATRAELRLSYSNRLEVEETTGASVDQVPAKDLGNSALELVVPLGNLQYGQSRDVFLRVKNMERLRNGTLSDVPNAFVEATLTYVKPEKQSSRRGGSSPRDTVVCRSSILEPSTTLTPDEIAYHESRSRICSFISSLFPIRPDGEHVHEGADLAAKRAELLALIEDLPCKPYLDARNASLMQDVASEEPKGQVFLAIDTDAAFARWGCHFLPSLLNAHARQLCNSFKDPGPLQYGVDSPLFKACRDALDKAFDDLPAPEPSRAPPRHMSGGGHGNSRSFKSWTPVKMSSYNNSMGVCFSGSTPVALASGRAVEMRRLRRGMKVRTPSGARRVAAVLRTRVTGEVLIRMGSTLVTPWHPVSTDSAAKTWGFPAQTVGVGAVLYTGSIYSVMLERQAGAAAHAVRVGDVWGVTLGHGLVAGGDARAHAFFGDYNAVGKSLMTLERRRGGVVVGGGVERDEATGRVRGFRRPVKGVRG